MPQMKPMNWLFLTFYFLMSYMLMNNFMYFFFYKHNFNNKENVKIKKYLMFKLKW